MYFCKKYFIKPIITLIKKDLLLEFRQQYSLYGVLLYLCSTTFIIYLTHGQPEKTVWNALFWLVQLFVCVNAVAKSFLQESRGRMIYYYSIAGARDFIISKLCFNAILMLGMSLIVFLAFLFFLGNPLYDVFTFLGITVLGGFSFSLIFSFLAAIAAKAQQQAAMMAIMGFPLIIPLILLLMKIANIAFAPIVQAGLTQLILLVCGLDVLIIALAIILFPFLWKD